MPLFLVSDNLSELEQYWSQERQKIDRESQMNIRNAFFFAAINITREITKELRTLQNCTFKVQKKSWYVQYWKKWLSKSILQYSWIDICKEKFETLFFKGKNVDKKNNKRLHLEAMLETRMTKKSIKSKKKPTKPSSFDSNAKPIQWIYGGNPIKEILSWIVIRNLFYWIDSWMTFQTLSMIQHVFKDFFCHII